MQSIISDKNGKSVVLKEKTRSEKRKIKRAKTVTPRMEKTKELIKEGYSIQMAMREAGYKETTIKSRSRDYLKMLDLPELLQGLKYGSALLGYKAQKVISEELDGEKAPERIKAADVATKMSKQYIGEDKSPPKIIFHFQTIQDQQITINPPEKTEIIDVSPEAEESE